LIVEYKMHPTALLRDRLPFVFLAQYKDMPTNDATDTANPDEEEWKKYHAMHEMSRLHKLTVKTYCQCLLLTVFVAVGLTYVVFVSPFRMSAPDASNFLNWSAFSFFALLAFVMVTCSDSSPMRFALVVTMAVFYGFSAGFLLALNFTVEATQRNSLRGVPSRYLRA